MRYTAEHCRKVASRSDKLRMAEPSVKPTRNFPLSSLYVHSVFVRRYNVKPATTFHGPMRPRYNEVSTVHVHIHVYIQCVMYIGPVA